MIITRDDNLRNFEPWSGAIETFKRCTWDELDTIEMILEDCYPEGCDETFINDLFWFDDDFILDCIGAEYDEFWSREV